MSGLLERTLIQRLDGDWHFMPDPGDEGENEGWCFPGKIRGRLIKVPACWETQFDDLRYYCGPAWYEKSFTVPSRYEDKMVVVVFKAANFLAKIWVNGKYVDEHEGGYTPFAFDLSELIQFDKENTITVKITNFEDLSEVPAGKQAWYIRMSGIWQSVWLEERGRIYISDLHVIPDVDKSIARIHCEIVSPPLAAKAFLRLRLVIKSSNKRISVSEKKLIFPKNPETFSMLVKDEIRIENVLLWDLDNPNLYRLTASLVQQNGEVIDSASTDFGMRKFEVKGPYFCLNDKPIYLIGATDQPDTPDKNIYRAHYTYPTDDDLKREIQLAKELGINLVRKHVRCEDPRYLYWADRLGILVWEEPPHYERFTQQSQQRWKETLTAMIIRDRNHPSTVIWCLYNETWGLSAIPREKAHDIMEEMYDYVKGLDPTRPICANSGGFVLFNANLEGNHGKTDFEDVHTYVAAPEFYERFRDWAAKLKARDKPLIASEFGIMGLPNIEKMKQQNGGQTPWWLSKQVDTLGLGYVKDYEENFYKWRLDTVFENFEKFTKVNEWHLFEGLKYEIEQIRKNPNVVGYAITSLFDAFWEPLGLIDYFRDPKIFHREIRRIQSKDLVLLDWSRLNFWSEEKFTAEMFVSHWSPLQLKGSVIRWALEDYKIHGEITNVCAQETGVIRMGEINFRLPKVQTSGKARLHLSLERAGRIASENHIDICIFPKKHLRLHKNQKVYVNVPSFSLAKNSLERYHISEKLRIVGYNIAEKMDSETPVAISTMLDSQSLKYVLDGGTLLFFPRFDSDLSQLGLWIGEPPMGLYSPIYYVDKSHGLFDEIPFDNPLGWQFYRVFPQFVIGGVQHEKDSDVLAGCYGSGWIKMPVETHMGKRMTGEVFAVLFQRAHGNGRILITTFNLIEPFLDDPVATIMLNDLLQYATPLKK